MKRTLSALIALAMWGMSASPAFAQELDAVERGAVVDKLIGAADLQGEARRAMLDQLIATAPSAAQADAYRRARAAAGDDATLDQIMRAALAAPTAEPVAAPAPAAPTTPTGPALAVPVGGTPSAPTGAPGLAIPRPTTPNVVQRPPASLELIRAYQASYLTMDRETELHGGGSTYVSTGWGWGRRGRYYGGVVLSAPNPVYTTQTWAVYQANQRLEVPEFYEVVGDENRALELDSQLRRYQGTATALYVAGALGLVTTVVGWYGSRFGETPAIRQNYSLAGLAGSGVSLVGFIGGAIPSARARHTRYDFPYVTDSKTAQSEIDAYNERLRTELGLSTADVMRAEQQK